MERADLIGRILKIAGDYRKGEISKFDSKHIEKWVEQFQVSEEHKNVILLEVGHMLENFYISRDQAKENLFQMFKIMKEERAGGCSIADVTFLRTQEVGKSQQEILLIADEILKEHKGVKSQDCGGSKVYLYLDDCIYSGSKWRNEIKQSKQLIEAPNGITLISFHFGIYSGGYNYSRPIIQDYLAKKKGTLKPFKRNGFKSDRFAEKELDILWPAYVAGNKQVDAFVKNSNTLCVQKGWQQRPLFRTNQTVSANVFTSIGNQHIVEQAFLAVGAKLFCVAQNPAPSVRPMGFEVIGTIGFGTPIVTWRNIANNCPLALWYGDLSYGPGHPLGMWYPLFPRKM